MEKFSKLNDEISRKYVLKRNYIPKHGIQSTFMDKRYQSRLMCPLANLMQGATQVGTRVELRQCIKKVNLVSHCNSISMWGTQWGVWKGDVITWKAVKVRLILNPENCAILMKLCVPRDDSWKAMRMVMIPWDVLKCLFYFMEELCKTLDIG